MPCIKVIGVFLVPLMFVSAYRYTCLWPVVTMMLGVLLASWQGLELQRSWLPESYQGKTVELEGRITGLPADLTRLQRFTLGVESAGVIKRIRLSWYGGPELIPGERWRLQVKIKPPLGNSSPGAFDMEAWAAREGIQATGYVVSGVWLSEGSGSLIDWRDRLRQSIRQRVNGVLNSDSSGLLVALMVGDKSGISPQQWQSLNQTGTTHLMVISGLHIGLMATLGFWLMTWLGQLGLLPLRSVPLPVIAAVSALFLALGYAFLAGFSIPVQRALVMAGVALSGPLLGIRAKPSTLFLLALALVLTIDPLAMTSAGFWYSFSAVGALLYGFSGRVEAPGRWQRWVRPQWVVFLLLLPLLLFNGQSVSLLSPVINLFAIPLVAGLMVPMALLALLLGTFSETLFQWLLIVIDGLLSYFMQALLWLTQSVVGAVSVSSHSAGLTGVWFAVVGVLLLLSPPALGLRKLMAVIVLPWLWPGQRVPETGQADIIVFDVGQGLSVLVRTRFHTLLYDTGGGVWPRLSMADRIVIPYFKREGVTRLDQIVISHGDNDHAGGLISLQTSIPYDGVRAGSGLPGYSGYVQACELGQVWEWDRVRFEFLQGSGRWSHTNDRSCVLKITANGQSLLLTGDIGKRSEHSLVNRFSGNKATTLLSDYLLLPHHGSKYSGSDLFLQQVQPDVVLISSGYLNRFRHPAPEALERVAKTGARVFDTAKHGTIRFTLGGSGEVTPCRQEKQRYWHRPSL